MKFFKLNLLYCNKNSKVKLNVFVIRKNFLYTKELINTFLTDDIERNNIVTQEQAAGKKGVLGTVEQLLIKKNILKVVESLCRNLYTVWLDYKKALDSIPHKWLLKSFEFAKVPRHMINAIKNLTESLLWVFFFSFFKNFDFCGLGMSFTSKRG